MYAVIETGGKQYLVQEGDKIRVEKLDVTSGNNVTFESVLMLGDNSSAKIGEPKLEGSTVSAELIANGRHKKITVFKKQRRKGYRRTKGHKQHYTEVKITGINA